MSNGGAQGVAQIQGGMSSIPRAQPARASNHMARPAVQPPDPRFGYASPVGQGNMVSNMMYRPPAAQTSPPAATSTAERAPNINQTAAQGINDAIAGARSEMNYQPGMVRPSGYNATAARGRGYRSTDADSQGYSAERIGSTPNVGADNVQSGQLSSTDLSPYMNQYEGAVVDSTLSDLDRARQLQQQNIGANATAAGAFGGSRHALREAENNRNFYDQAAKTAASLRQAGFNNAQQMGLTDIGNTMRADLANQGANLQADSLTANLAQQGAMSNQAAQNRAAEFGASAGNTAALTNAAAANQANQFGAAAGNTAALANQAAFNQAGQFNAQQRQAAQMANQAAGLAGSQQRLSAGNQLGNLSNLGFGMGQTLTSNLAQDGAMKQGLNQLLIDAARNQFNQYTNSPFQSIGLLSQALGASPVPQTTNTSKQPGLFDYLTLGAGMM